MLLEIPRNSTPSNDKMAVLLSEIQQATATTDERRRGHWIGIHSDQWRRILGGSYAQIIREAESLGFVEVNHKYSVDRFTKSIRLSALYRTPEVQQFRLRQAIKTRGDVRIRLEQDDVTGQLLATAFNEFTLPQNVCAAGWDAFSTRAVQRRSWYAVRCPYRRLHTSFTGLPKTIRRELRTSGQRTVEIDVANCQPLILGMLAETRTGNQDAYTICCTGWQNRQFIELCSRGLLYEFLQSKTGWNRDRVKRQFLVLVFANNSLMQRLPIWPVVSREFPSLAEFVFEHKRHEYQNLARDCQRFESKLMIDGVAAELVRKFPVLTVHDSIVVAKQYVNEVAATIRHRFAERGVEVTTKRSVA